MRQHRLWNRRHEALSPFAQCSRHFVNIIRTPDDVVLVDDFDDPFDGDADSFTLLPLAALAFQPSATSGPGIRVFS
jgi:hypothetical protein